MVVGTYLAVIHEPPFLSHQGLHKQAIQHPSKQASVDNPPPPLVSRPAGSSTHTAGQWLLQTSSQACQLAPGSSHHRPDDAHRRQPLNVLDTQQISFVPSEMPVRLRSPPFFFNKQQTSIF